MKFLLCMLLMLSSSVFASDPYSAQRFAGEDGYHLWMKYDLLANGKLRHNYREALQQVSISGQSDTLTIIHDELQRATQGLLGQTPVWVNKVSHGLIISKPTNTLRQQFNLDKPLKKLGKEGFIIRSQGQQILITANTDVGLLYGTFHLLRLMQTGQSLMNLNVRQVPKINLRMLNHWDNLDRHVERGYAGESIFDWFKLPSYQYQRYYDYARANASIGINGTVLNNVNANAMMLSPRYLQKVKALADIFRPYGIKVFLSIKFSSPEQLGGLETADPLNPAVAKWWQDKAKQIYAMIPDFGGFLVKANSEGQPGPGDYHRTHAQGANMLAKALKPYGGVVIWRAFVYNNDPNKERSLQAYDEFVPLDGKFADNVAVQVKNGPIDFQPREPFSPLFGTMAKTPLAMEFQVTQEYLGFSTHLVYLGTLFKEVLDTDTYAKGKGSTVAKVIDGSLEGHKLSIMAGVANIGTDRNWTGHIFAQANWYALGRLAWNHDLSARQIAKEWTQMTLTRDSGAVKSIVDMMMQSRQTTVDYMTPLGLHHIMGTGHHYGPAPWVSNLSRADWNPVYYHRADKQGIGFNRTASGSNAVSQYAPHWQKIFSSPAKTPEKLLLWFHHVSWDHKMPEGDTLWQELVKRYYGGVDKVVAMQRLWKQLTPYISPNQHEQVRMALINQHKEAIWWRNACVLYFQTFSKRPIPAGLPKPDHSLEYYQSLHFPDAPGRG